MPSELMAARVEATPGTPAPYGLLSVATMPELGDRHELNGVTWRPYTCGEALTTTWCPPDGDPEPDPKEFVGVDPVYAPPVTVYYGYTCPPIGETLDEARAYARAGLTMGEGYALEQYVWSDLLAPIATDRTPVSGPVSVPQGVATIESYLAAEYGGVGIIHMPVGVAAVAGNGYVLLADGARRRTWAGNMVAIGAGYFANTGPDGEPAADGTAWLYASGPVVIRRENPDLKDTVDIVVNDRLVLAERTYVIGVECAVEAILVEVSCCC